MISGLQCRGVVLIFLVCIYAPLASATSSDSELYVGFDIGGLTGDFGSTIDSDLYSIQVIGGLLASSYDASISIPYLTQKNDPSFKDEGLGDVLFLMGHTLLPEQSNGLSFG